MYDNPASVVRVFERLDSLEALMSEAGSPEAFEPLVSKRLDEATSELIAIAAQFEAGDLIEAIRRNEMPTTLEGYRESESRGLLVVIELVALLANPARDEHPGSGPGLELDDLERVANLGHRIIRLVTFLRLAWRERAEPHPLLELSYVLAEQALIVRSMHYEHIRKRYFELLFMAEPVAELSRRLLGFTWQDFDTTSRAMISILEDRLNSAIQVVGEAGGFEKDATDSPEYLKLMGKPASYAAFTRDDLAEATELDPGVLSAVLSFLSLVVGQTDPRTAMSQLISGKNPYEGKSLAALPNGRYVVADPAQSLDGFRSSVERVFKRSAKDWNTYERVRAAFAENEAARLLTNLLGGPPLYSNLKYFGPEGASAMEAYASHVEALPETRRLYEVDHLFVIENVAIAVEVKAGGLTPPARAGYADRLARDLERTLGEAARQARRLRDLAIKNSGIWDGDRNWVDLSSVDIVHTVVVALGDFGDAAIAMTDLAAANLIPAGDFPWVVSLHDLAVIAQLVEIPALFLLYLRRRTSPEIATLFSTSDELDLLMLFMKGGLYAHPSPALLQAQDPTGQIASGRQRKDFERQVQSIVKSHTDDLDAWIHFSQGTTQEVVVRPEFRANERILALVNWLADERKPGWFGFGADLLDGSSNAQDGIARFLDGIVSKSETDGESHSFAHGMNGQWGYVLLVAATRGDGETQEESLRKLQQYATLKKYQTHAARALVLLLGPGVDEPVYEAVGFISGQWQRDPEMEKLVAKFLPPLRDGRPPSAKRATRRLR